MPFLLSKARTIFSSSSAASRLLGKFLDTEDGKNLLAGYKRATNIIRIEEKKDSRDYTGAPEPKLYKQDEEKALARAIDAAKAEATRAVEKEDFAAAMTAMAKLRPDVDAFFDKVTVNVEDKALRENRLKLSTKSAPPPAPWRIFPRSRGDTSPRARAQAPSEPG